jgi:pimeloyl-ACP methyl ester carboxylesterase
MERFSSFDGTEIAYLDEGDGPTVFLLHGFAADHHLNWTLPGVVGALVASGRRVIAADARGHGASAKPHDPASYSHDAMVRDAQALMDHLGCTDVHVVGYSMGSLTSTRLVPQEKRARSLVLGGVGGRMASGRPTMNRARVADALEAVDAGAVEDPSARAFRAFAERTGADRLALAAVLRGQQDEPAVLGQIAVPTLVLTGDRDTLVGPPQELAERIPGATFKVLNGDHLSATADPAFPASIVEFINSVEAG